MGIDLKKKKKKREEKKAFNISPFSQCTSISVFLMILTRALCSPLHALLTLGVLVIVTG